MSFCQISNRNFEPQKIMSKNKESSKCKPGLIGWNELATSDVPAAKKFYAGLLGWKTKPFGKGVDYTLFMKGKDMIGGLMKCPKPGKHGQWIPYVYVTDVDATAKKVKKLRGKLCCPPTDVPNVGRIAVLTDPQGGVIGIIKPKM
jgi:predicted enzyme related to lactoylglutathione lyase